MGGSALFYLCLALGLASAAPDFSGESDAVEPPRLIGPPLDLRIPAQSALDAVQVEVILTINKRGEVVEVQDLPLASARYDWLLARLLRLTFIPAVTDWTGFSGEGAAPIRAGIIATTKSAGRLASVSRRLVETS